MQKQNKRTHLFLRIRADVVSNCWSWRKGATLDFWTGFGGNQFSAVSKKVKFLFRKTKCLLVCLSHSWKFWRAPTKKIPMRKFLTLCVAIQNCWCCHSCPVPCVTIPIGILVEFHRRVRRSELVSCTEKGRWGERKFWATITRDDQSQGCAGYISFLTANIPCLCTDSYSVVVIRGDSCWDTPRVMAAERMSEVVIPPPFGRLLRWPLSVDWQKAIGDCVLGDAPVFILTKLCLCSLQKEPPAFEHLVCKGDSQNIVAKTYLPEKLQTCFGKSCA